MQFELIEFENTAAPSIKVTKEGKVSFMYPMHFKLQYPEQAAILIERYPSHAKSFNYDQRVTHGKREE